MHLCIAFSMAKKAGSIAFRNVYGQIGGPKEKVGLTQGYL